MKLVNQNNKILFISHLESPLCLTFVVDGELMDKSNFACRADSWLNMQTLSSQVRDSKRKTPVHNERFSMMLFNYLQCNWLVSICSLVYWWFNLHVPPLGRHTCSKGLIEQLNLEVSGCQGLSFTFS